MAPDSMSAAMTRQAGWAVATIRVFHDGESSVAESVSNSLNTSWPQRHGDLTGSDPWLIWRNPLERLAFASSQERLAPLYDRMEPGTNEAGCAVDLSEAIGVWRLEGATLSSTLARLCDADAVPPPGRATRLRFADIAVVLVRQSENEAYLLADATLEPYLRSWWAYACEGL